MIKVPHWLPVGQTIPWLEELGDPRFRVPGDYAPKMKIPEAEKTPAQKSAEGAQRVLEEMGRVPLHAPRPGMIPPGRSDYLQQFLEEGEEQKPGTRDIQLRRKLIRKGLLPDRAIQPVYMTADRRQSVNVRDLRDPPEVKARNELRMLKRYEAARIRRETVGTLEGTNIQEDVRWSMEQYAYERDKQGYETRRQLRELLYEQEFPEQERRRLIRKGILPDGVRR